VSNVLACDGLLVACRVEDGAAAEGAGDPGRDDDVAGGQVVDAGFAEAEQRGGAYRTMVARSIRSGIFGLPQSRALSNVQSSVAISPTAPAARARSTRADQGERETTGMNTWPTITAQDLSAVPAVRGNQR
jgi:hypothetical protein